MRPLTSGTFPSSMRWGMIALILVGCGQREPQPTSPTRPVEPRATTVDAAPAPAKPDCKPDIVRIRDVEALRAAVADCNGNAFDGRRTALMAAAERGDPAAVDVLLRAGADPNVRLESGGTLETGKTALWFAISAVSADVVKKLLDARADPNLFPPEGLPLLVLAVLKDSVPIARLLVDGGIDVRQTTRRGATPMTYDNGPSAAMFAYLTSVNVATDGMSREQIESLRWENEHAPGADASADAVVRFASEVIAKTRSARARENAIERIAKAGPAARAAVPALVDVVRGAPLAQTDWSRVRAVEALAVIGWGAELVRELSRLLDAVAAAPQQLRLALIDLIVAAPAETKRAAVQRLRALAKKSRDRAVLEETAAAIEKRKAP